MPVEKIWKIEKLETESPKEGKPNIVTAVHWACTGTDGTYVGRVFKMMPLPAPVDDFVEFEKLTESQVIGWIHSLMGKETKEYWENLVDIQIEKNYRLKPQAPDLPWV